MDARELLIETVAHIPVARALEQLSEEDAERHIPGATHSIAEIVAHLAFWQDWFLRRCEGIAEPAPERASLGWPQVEAGKWPGICAQFLSGLQRAAEAGSQVSRMDNPIVPALEFPPLTHYTIHDATIHIAIHNAHHLGQIILLRQMMGLWPPPSGGWTW